MTDANNIPASDNPEFLEVLIIGAGFSGVCTGIKLLEKGITNFRIFEKSQGIGGTWYDNTYPGAACDVPSHFYCFSFEPNPNWSRVFSPRAEIQTYVEHCVDKYGLRPHIENGAKVLRLRLDESEGLWHATFENGKTLRARHVINGAGGLHEPSIPAFEGRDSFEGPAMHTARWDHSVDLTGKRVAVIGSAASAIQVIPEVAKVATKLTVFQRTPNYIVPRNDRDYTDKEKRRFARWPWFARLYRWFIFMRMELILFPITKRNSMMGRRAGSRVMDHMRESVRDTTLQEKLVPNYAMGCKRILLSDDLFAALNRDNVTVVGDGIKRIERNGVRTEDGTLHEADVIVYATGYDIDAHVRSIDITGVNGRSLHDDWKDGQEAYNGCCIAGYPNYFMVTGPNTGVGTTSVVFMIEQEVGYILKLIHAADDDTLISVKHDAQRAYNEKLQADLENTVWMSGCQSWYLNDDGKVTTLYPNNARTFRRQLERVNLEDFELRLAPSRQSTAA